MPDAAPGAAGLLLTIARLNSPGHPQPRQYPRTAPATNARGDPVARSRKPATPPVSIMATTTRFRPPRLSARDPATSLVAMLSAAPPAATRPAAPSSMPASTAPL